MKLRRLVKTVLLAILPVFLFTYAQSQTIVLSVLLPPAASDVMGETYFDDFKAAHPGVDVVVLRDEAGRLYPPWPTVQGIDPHLDAVAELAASADVIWAHSANVTIESTHAGYWLDLAPLASADTTLSAFYPSALRAYQWDNALWALPAALEPTLLMYDPSQFDAAGLPYPDDNYTLEAFADAARALTVRDASGTVTRAGFLVNYPVLFYNQLGRGFYAVENGRIVPQLQDAELETMLEIWRPIPAETMPPDGFSTRDVGLMMMMEFPQIPGTQYQLTLLPGGTAPMRVEGTAVSAGTQHPELAYALARYLTEHPFPLPFGASRSARTDITMPARENFLPVTLTPEQEALVAQAIDQAIVPSDLLFSSYVIQALHTANENGGDVSAALAEAQQAALTHLQAAANRDVNVVVASAQPTRIPEPNAVVLNFGINPTMSVGMARTTLPVMQENWQRVVDEFAAADPEIDHVFINIYNDNFDTFKAENDCYYFQADPFSNAYSAADFVSLAPLIDADAEFVLEDLLPGVLAQIQVNGQIYAYPYTLNPVVLHYEPETLTAAKIALPTFDWTVEQFVDTLNQLETSDPQATPFSPRQGQNTDFLILIAAFGGLPLDYRTNPPTFNLTTPENIAAIRQVLDLAKNGLIAYAQLGTNTFSGSIPRGTLAASLLSGQLAESRAFIDFPQGSRYSGLSLGDISAGYISATTTRPEACYRLLRALAGYPELFAGAMPVRRSALQDPTLKAGLGEERVALFQRYADRAAQPNAVVFPTNALSGTRAVDLFMMNYWMNRAFDRYVLENADLETELSAAQALIEAFQTCMAEQPVPARGANLLAQQIYFAAGYACFARIDPDTYAAWTTQ